MSKLTFTNHAPILIDDRLPPPGPGCFLPTRPFLPFASPQQLSQRFDNLDMVLCTWRVITAVNSSVNPDRCGTEIAKQRSHRKAHLDAKGHPRLEL